MRLVFPQDVSEREVAGGFGAGLVGLWVVGVVVYRRREEEEEEEEEEETQNGYAVGGLGGGPFAIDRRCPGEGRGCLVSRSWARSGMMGLVGKTWVSGRRSFGTGRVVVDAGMTTMVVKWGMTDQ